MRTLAPGPGEQGGGGEVAHWILDSGRYVRARHPAILMLFTEACGNLGAAYEDTRDSSAARRPFDTGLRVASGSAWLAGGLACLTADQGPSQAAPAGGLR